VFVGLRRLPHVVPRSGPSLCEEALGSGFGAKFRACYKRVVEAWKIRVPHSGQVIPLVPVLAKTQPWIAS
jgi:hypothetical protein